MILLKAYTSQKSPNPASEIIKYRIALRLNQLADAEVTLQQMMNREDMSTDLVVYAITLLAETKYGEIGHLCSSSYTVPMRATGPSKSLRNACFNRPLASRSQTE